MSDADFRREVRSILEAIGEDPDRQGLRRTPERVELALRRLTRGYGMSVQDVVGDACFEEQHEAMILVRDIEIYSLCEHHMLPFFGRAHVAYIPDGRIVGLSNWARSAIPRALSSEGRDGSPRYCPPRCARSRPSGRRRGHWDRSCDRPCRPSSRTGPG